MSARELMPAPAATPGQRGIDSTQSRRGRHGRDVPRRRGESWIVFAIACAGYLLVGNWLVVDLQVVGFETLEHLNRALMLWHNDPAKLAAIGVDGPPLLTAAFAPLTIIAPLASSLAVVPVVSAVALAGALTVLNTLMRRCGLSIVARLLLLAAVGINPLWLHQATGGRPQVLATALLVAALAAMLAWYLTADLRFVLGAGVLFAVMFLASFTAVLWAAIAAVLIAVVLSRVRASGAEVEGSLIGFGMPLGYLATGWVVLVSISTGSPSGLIDRTGPPAPAFGEVASDTFAFVTANSPLTYGVVVLLLIAGIVRKDPPSLFLAAAVLIAAALPGALVLTRLTSEPMAHHNGLTLFAVTVVGAVWLLNVWQSNRGPAALLLVVLLVASIPWTLQQMRTYPAQRLEANFAAAITSGTSQDGKTSVAGDLVGISDELEMATYLKDNLDLDATASVLTDDAQTYAVMLLTGAPDLFFDRVDAGDAAWLEQRDEPDREVTHFLVSNHPDDLLAEVVTDLPVVFETDRYLLVEVDHTPTPAPRSAPTTDADSGATQGAP